MCAAAFLGNNNSWEGKMWSWLSDPSLTGMINIMTIMKTLRLLYLSLHGKLEDGMGFSLVISTSGNRTNNSGSIWVRGFVPNPRYQGHSEQTVRGSEVIFFASLSKGYLGCILGFFFSTYVTKYTSQEISMNVVKLDVKWVLDKSSPSSHRRCKV